MENVIEQNIEINETISKKHILMKSSIMMLLQWNLIKEAQVLFCFLKNT